MITLDIRGRLTRAFSALTVNLTIRSKLLLAFLFMISLTVAVGFIAIASQHLARSTVDELVQVHGKIARLSLETDKALKIMNGYEKDFLLNYTKIGIRKAKELYLDNFIATGAEIKKNLLKIEEIAINDREKEVSRQAIDAIGGYQSVFLDLVKILELRVDPESGELITLQNSLNGMQDVVRTIESARVQVLFQKLLYTFQEYMLFPGRENSAKLLDIIKAFLGGIKIWVGETGTGEAVTLYVQREMETFTRLFTDVSQTDETIAAQIAVYQKAFARAEPIIQSLHDITAANEAAAVKRMENTGGLAQITVIGVGSAAVILGLLIAFGLAGGLTRQIGHIMDLLSEMGMGNTQARTRVVSNDELGKMATALNVMLDNLTTLIQSEEERDSIQESILKLMTEINALTEGNLTTRAEVTEDITGDIANSFNTMAEQFGEIVRQVKSATFSVDETASDVSRLTADLAAKSMNQTRQVDIAIETINEMAASVRQVSESAARSAKVSETSRINAREGAEAVEKTNRAMDEIRQQISDTARSIKRLGQSSMEIGNVVGIIDTIAKRTSILALNASIQAATAGEAGYGFAVVAEEVQRLAESSGKSTKQIDALVKSIQAEIIDVSTRMDESISKVVFGSQLADGAHEKLQHIEAVSNQLADLIDSITREAAKQVETSERVIERMVAVGSISNETSKTSQSTADQMNLLNTTAARLRQAVEMFKIEKAQTT